MLAFFCKKSVFFGKDSTLTQSNMLLNDVKCYCDVKCQGDSLYHELLRENQQEGVGGGGGGVKLPTQIRVNDIIF